MKKKFNEEFTDLYNGTASALTKFDLEPKAHAELNPVYADAVAGAKRVRERMKDDFKEQDEEVKKFLKAQDLVENPKIKSTKELKAMKLSENADERRSSGKIKKGLSENKAIGGRGAVVKKNITACRTVKESYGDKRYSVNSYYGKDYRGLEDDFESDDWSEVEMWCHEHLMKGGYIEITDSQTGARERIDPDKYNDEWEENNGEFPLKPWNFEESVRRTSKSGKKPVVESKSLKEDYSNYVGKPLKDLLQYIYQRGSNNPRVNIDYGTPAMGVSGYSGVSSDVPWYASDLLVKDVQLGDGKYYDFKVITESKKLNEARTKGATGGIEGFEYVIIAADENNKKKKSKTAKGVNKLIGAIEKWDNKFLDEVGATQLYAYRKGEDPDNPIYLKVSDDKGNWFVDVDNIEMEKSHDVRGSLFNKIQADLSSENSPEVKALRQISRDGLGKNVGIEAEELGFRERGDHDGVFLISTTSDKAIDWAKKVADFYGITPSEVVEKDGKKYIELPVPGIMDDPLMK